MFDPITWGMLMANGLVVEETSLPEPPEPIIVLHDMWDDYIFNDITDGQNLPCNFLSWMDLAAYLDWAALRPMTELEFEKICRGPNPPIAGEYVWGT